MNDTKHFGDFNKSPLSFSVKMFTKLIFVLIVISGTGAGEIWSMFHHDLNNTGVSEYNSYSNGSLKNIFSISNNYPYNGGFAIDTDFIYTANESYILKYYKSNGSIDCKYATGSTYMSGVPTLTDTSILVQQDGTRFYSVNKSDCSFDYFINNGGSYVAPVFYNSFIYSVGGNTVKSIYPSNQTINWNFAKNLFTYSAPAIKDDILYVGGREAVGDYRLYAVYTQNGTQVWSFPVGGYIFSSPVIYNNSVFITSLDNKLYKVSLDGNEVWNASLNSDTSSCWICVTTGTPAIKDNVIYVGSSDYNFYAFYEGNGTQKWSYTTVGSIHFSPIISKNDIIYFAADNASVLLGERIYSLYANGSLNWVYDILNGYDDNPSMDENGNIYFGNESSIFVFNSQAPSSPPINYDPSGYINDSNGNPLLNAKVVLSNSTYNVTDYTNAAGYWNVNIYANGTYFYNASLNGYQTASGSQAFTMGGTNYNFTLTPNSARIYGTVYEWTNQSGSKSIVGDLKSIRRVFDNIKKYKVYRGATLTLPIGADGKTYVLHVEDVDISGTSATIKVTTGGNDIYFSECGGTICIVEENKDYKYKLSSTNTIDYYLTLNIGTIFVGGGDISWVEITPSDEVKQKSTSSIWDVLYYWVSYFNTGTIGTVHFFIDLVNWLSFSPEQPNTMVTFNASSGNSAEAQMVMDFSSDTTLTTYSITIRTNNNGEDGKIGYGFTDDNIDVPPNYKDVPIKNGYNEYGTKDYRNFSNTDTNGNKKIKVWLYFYSGYGSQWDFNYFVTAFCLGCNLKPLADATIYKSYNNYTKSSTIGFYNLYVPFGTYNISYYKDGYESKLYPFTFNATNNNVRQDVTLNQSSVIVTEKEHYINVQPDPSNYGTAISAYYKTLGIYSYYKISVCPFNDEVNCIDSYDSDSGVLPNKESFIPLKTYPINTYSIYLSGKDLLDWNWNIVAVNNFTIISSEPTAVWESSLYYLGDTMRVNVYVPTGNEYLVIYYPNSTVLLQENFTAATTIQNKTVPTNNYSTPGTYTAELIGHGNRSITVLSPYSNTNYTLSAPSTVVWGKSFTVQYISPKTSELIILKSDGSQAFPTKTVSGSKTASFNTSSLENKEDTLTIQLIQNGVTVKASTTIRVTTCTSCGQIAGAGDTDVCTSTIPMLNGWISLTGWGLNNTTRLIFSLLFIIGFIMLGWGITHNGTIGVVLGFLPYAFFASLSFTNCGVEFMPKWVTIFLGIILALSFRIIR